MREKKSLAISRHISFKRQIYDRFPSSPSFLSIAPSISTRTLILLCLSSHGKSCLLLSSPFMVTIVERCNRAVRSLRLNKRGFRYPFYPFLLSLHRRRLNDLPTDFV